MSAKEMAIGVKACMVTHGWEISPTYMLCTMDHGAHNNTNIDGGGTQRASAKTCPANAHKTKTRPRAAVTNDRQSAEKDN